MARRGRWFIAIIAIPLAITVGLLSIGEPSDAWGAPTPHGVTIHSSLHPEHAVVAPRRRPLDSWRVLAFAVALLVALIEVGRRTTAARVAPCHRFLRGDPLARRRGPPLVLPI